MKSVAKLVALPAMLLSLAVLGGCSQTGMGDGLGVKSAVAKIVPGSPSSTRGKRYRASERERQCLARAMFFESNRSSRDGLVAVGSVVMNRRDTGKWGSDICSVVGAKRQFAPGVLSRSMNSRALPDVMAAADAVLAGERHGKVHKDVMFFHTAGLKFPYKNMHYTVVAGGNSFYEKRSRRPMRNDLPAQPNLAPEVMIASAEQSAPVIRTAMAGSEPTYPDTAIEAAPRFKTATALPSAASDHDNAAPVARTVKPSATPVMMASAASVPVRTSRAAPTATPAMDTAAETFPPAPPQPSTIRFGSAPTTLQAQAEEIDQGGTGPSMSFGASDDDATEVGELLLMQQEQ